MATGLEGGRAREGARNANDPRCVLALRHRQPHCSRRYAQTLIAAVAATATATTAAVTDAVTAIAAATTTAAISVSPASQGIARKCHEQRHRLPPRLAAYAIARGTQNVAASRPREMRTLAEAAATQQRHYARAQTGLLHSRNISRPRYPLHGTHRTRNPHNKAAAATATVAKTHRSTCRHAFPLRSAYD